MNVNSPKSYRGSFFFKARHKLKYNSLVVTMIKLFIYKNYILQMDSTQVFKRRNFVNESFTLCKLNEFYFTGSNQNEHCNIKVFLLCFPQYCFCFFPSLAHQGIKHQQQSMHNFITALQALYYYYIHMQSTNSKLRLLGWKNKALKILSRQALKIDIYYQILYWSQQNFGAKG